MSSIGNKILDKYNKDKHFELSNILPNLNFIIVSDLDNEYINDICIYSQLNKQYKLLSYYTINTT